jgi:hypothetical protein
MASRQVESSNEFGPACPRSQTREGAGEAATKADEDTPNEFRALTKAEEGILNGFGAYRTYIAIL